MDFLQHQEEIKAYIETVMPTILADAELDNYDDYIDDFLDLDKYAKKKQLFYNFNNYTFDYMSNESNVEDFDFSVYLVFRGDKVSNLRKQMLNYASAFYKMFEDDGNLGGIADYGIIQTISFYPAAEGYEDVKVAEVSMRLHTERN